MALWPNGSGSIPRVSSEFNPARKHPITGQIRPHNGIDLVGWSTIKSPVDGTVTFARYNGGAGNMIVVKDAAGDTFVMMHNARFLVGEGTRVRAGQDIAIMGTTGSSTGVHSHFETRPGDRYYQNPRDYMAAHGGGSPAGGGSANLAAGQRTAGPNGVKRRAAPSASSAEAGEMLAPGTVGNFVGWRHAESVQGNNVWYQGTSGHWFWSGGFAEGANGTGLKDLNPAAPTPAPSGTQRKVGANGANGRKDPSTNGGVTQTLAPGTVGDFNGWKRGQDVSGNNVWFRGEHSGDWFWSGGFDGGANTAGLADLNPAAPTPAPSVGGAQRKAGGNGSNGRSDTNTSAGITTTLAGGAVGDFDGWKRGQSVEGNDIWFRGAHSGAWFWSGGFEDKGTHDLKDLNAAAPTPTPTPDPVPTTPGLNKNQRKVGANSVNGRTGPTRAFAIVQSLEAGTVGEFDGYADGEVVEGIGTWFRGALAKNWFWAGGFEDKGTHDLPKLEAPSTPTTPTTPTSSDNPRGLPTYTPVYPGAKIGLSAPLGDGKRGSKGVAPNVVQVPIIIDRLIQHHIGGTQDDLDFFSYKNSRGSCPTWYIRTDGTVIELIRPGMKSAATGPEWNWRSLSIELQNSSGAPQYGLTTAQHEAVAKIMAWLASFDGKTLDGVPVSFKIDRTHYIGHNEALPGSTICPGPSLNYTWIIERALAIRAAEEDSETPEPEQPSDEELAKVKAELVKARAEMLQVEQAWEAYKTALATVETPFQQVDDLLS